MKATHLPLFFLTVSWLFRLGTENSLAVDGETAPNPYHFQGPGKVCPAIVSLVDEVGGRVDWGSNNLISYDRLDREKGIFQTWITPPNGDSPRCISNLNPLLAEVNVGNPAWHPSGNYLVVQAADLPASVVTEKDLLEHRLLANPAYGHDNNLWLLSSDGSQSAALTQMGPGGGILAPHFSHRGDQLLWTQVLTRSPIKVVMKIGKFRVSPHGPQLTEIQTLDPLTNSIYETLDFSPDDQSILFSTSVNNRYHLHLVRMDLATGKTQNLTEPSETETSNQAHFSPDGRKIIWASSIGTPRPSLGKLMRTEYWIMNADGTGKSRLTYFNEPGAPEYRPSYNIAADVSWSPDGKEIIGLVRLLSGEVPVDARIGSILRITLP